MNMMTGVIPLKSWDENIALKCEEIGDNAHAS